MSSVIQRSLSGGELDPVLWARSDVTKYMTGLRTLRNAYVRRNGGVQGKPGSLKIQAIKDSTHQARLIPFIYNQSVTFTMEFGNYYVRFYQNGSAVAPAGATAWSNATNYYIGNMVTSGGNTYYNCWQGTGRGLVTINSIDFAANGTLYGTSIVNLNNAPAGGAPYWYLQPTGIYEIPSPFSVSQLAALKFDQTGNDMMFTHPDVGIFRLSRSVDGSGNSVFAWYSVYEGSYFVFMNAYNDQADSNTYLPTAAGVYTYAVVPVASNGDIYAQTGSETKGGFLTTTKTQSTTSAAVTLSWSPIAAAVSYNIYYRNVNGVYGLLGSTTSTSFQDFGYTPNYANPWIQDAGQIFGSANNYPSACAFYQQRAFFGNTYNNPTKNWGSQTGLYDNFNVNVPTLATDSLSFKMVGQQDVIQHLLSLGTLLVFTYGTINSVEGDQSGAISPSAINPHRETVHGAGSLRPLIVGEFALYQQSQGSVIRDLGFNFQVDGYRGDDLTVFATHLFDNYTITDWAYQSVPHSVVWAVRSDGTLLSLTYVREQQILAWAHHDTAAGFYENVCCIPEGNQVSVYVIANRTINGTTTRYVERFFNQNFTDVRNFVGMDCATTIDGRNTSADTVTISGGTNWNEVELLTVTLSANNFLTFTSGMATNNDFLFIYDASGNLYRFKITVYSSATVVQGFIDRQLPVSLQSTATASWSHAISVLSGLSYLNGQNVSVFGDGFVVGSPNNPAYPVYTVSGGSVTLDKPYAVIQVGLPFITDVETLDIDTPGMMENLGGEFKLVGQVTLNVVNSRTVFVGGENPDTDLTNSPYSPVYRLTEQKVRQNENYDSPMNLQTGKITQNIQPDWDQNGHVFIRNVDPTPFLLSAISPDGLYPMRTG